MTFKKNPLPRLLKHPTMTATSKQKNVSFALPTPRTVVLTRVVICAVATIVV